MNQSPRSPLIRHPIVRCFLILFALAATAVQSGCEPVFVQRDIFFNAAKAPGDTTTLLVLSMTDSEWNSLSSLYDKTSDKRKAELDRAIEGEWKDRSSLVKLEGKETHLLLKADDPLWKRFRESRSSRGDKMEWFAVVVYDTNWRTKREAWFAGYRGAPTDQFAKDVASLEFAWLSADPSDKERGPEGLKLLRSDGASPN